ncbi:hypothetical protein [Streptomyces sp. NPDC093591]|uniref:hypothetical protein n=1 Tax=Streptomyces sp. NPDC093591 TaxID=3366044 RepID=UPI0037F3B758
MLAAVHGAALALVVSGNAGAVEVSLAGRAPVTITTDRVSVSGLSLAPGGKSDAAFVELFKDFRAERVCLTSPVRLPLAGRFIVYIGMESMTASGFTIEAAGLSASRLSMSDAGLDVEANGSETSRPFELTAGSFKASQVTIKPRSYTAATMSAQGFHAGVSRDGNGCS